MKKILIFGNSASGKSTLARELSQLENLAHLDLDTLAWSSWSPPERTPLDAASKQIQHFIKLNSGWVIEGCYTDLLEVVSLEANEIIFMDLNLEQCIENARKRPWEPHKFQSKLEQDSKLEMLINWIKDYEIRDDIFSYRSHLNFYQKFSGKKSTYSDNERNLK